MSDELKLADFEDAEVQLVYGMVASGEEVPPKGEHWDGYIARRIVAELRALRAPVASRPATGGEDAGAWQAFKAWQISKGFKRPDDPGEWEAFQAGIASRPAAQADAEDAARPRGTKPRAWLHTMKYETGETTDRVTLTKENPWGISGRDYSEEYTVTSQPLGIIDAARQKPKT